MEVIYKQIIFCIFICFLVAQVEACVSVEVFRTPTSFCAPFYLNL